VRGVINEENESTVNIKAIGMKSKETHNKIMHEILHETPEC